MGSRAYREAPVIEASTPVRLTTRRLRALHIVAIPCALALCAFGLADVVTLYRVILALTVVMYSAGLVYGESEISGVQTLFLVPLVTMTVGFVIGLLAWDRGEHFWIEVACAVIAGSILPGVPATWLGWSVAGLLRARDVEPPPTPIVQPVAHPPRRSLEVVRPRAELPLDSVPDSYRPVLFAVRLRRRRFDRTRRD